MLKLLPLVVFLAMVGFLAKGLTLDPREVPSPLIDKPAPAFRLPTLATAGTASGAEFNTADMRGQVWVLNVFASWCASCVVEHPVLTRLARERPVQLIGLNYKDTPDAAAAWLSRFGNPYSQLLDDRAGDVGLDWGVYGVPETFIIDQSGQVRYKHIGPVDDIALDDILYPLLDELLGAPT